jgi:hypothetical protein
VAVDDLGILYVQILRIKAFAKLIQREVTTLAGDPFYAAETS